MWSDGTTMLLGRRPWGFKGLDTGPVHAHPLPGADAGEDRVVQLGADLLAGVPSASSPFHASPPGAEELVPVALVDARPASDGELRMRVLTCSRVRLAGTMFCLVWEGTVPSTTSPRELLDHVAAASRHQVELMTEESAQAGNLLADTEMELKLTLQSDVGPWEVASLLGRAVHAGELTGFGTDLGNEIQRWTYEQATYQVFRDGESAGYVAFMLARSGKYHVKYKLFGADQLRRLETFDKHVDLDPSEFELYLRDHMPDCTFHALPLLVRSRFDVNVLSLGTGHYYGLETDEIHADGQTMRQLEIEYHRTQHVLGASSGSIEDELDRLAGLVERTLRRAGIAYRRGFTSKLTWLLEVEAGRS